MRCLSSAGDWSRFSSSEISMPSSSMPVILPAASPSVWAICVNRASPIMFFWSSGEALANKSGSMSWGWAAASGAIMPLGTAPSAVGGTPGMPWGIPIGIPCMGMPWGTGPRWPWRPCWRPRPRPPWRPCWPPWGAPPAACCCCMYWMYAAWLGAMAIPPGPCMGTMPNGGMPKRWACMYWGFMYGYMVPWRSCAKRWAMAWRRTSLGCHNTQNSGLPARVWRLNRSMASKASSRVLMHT
mmetsp:Transcript_24338/g.50469  ORF Transcript_24338/g.50469 Transcript_24338/m.50469 type:complete len:240 (-) Transcript_24338:1266-1985(-)